MIRAATVKVRLCSVCRVKSRGAGGRLARCLDCLKADVDRERQHREAIAKHNRPGSPPIRCFDHPLLRSHEDRLPDIRPMKRTRQQQ